MELKQVIRFNVSSSENGDKFFFQCNKCGDAKKLCRIIEE